MSGFLNKRSLLFTAEIPPSPISNDDSALGSLDNFLITTGAINLFLKVLCLVKEHNNLCT